MKLKKEIHLSWLASKQIGKEGYKKLKFNTYYADDYIRPGTEIPDDWNMVIAKMHGCVPALVPRDKVQDYADEMVQIYGSRYFYDCVKPEVFEIENYVG